MYKNGIADKANLLTFTILNNIIECVAISFKYKCADSNQGSERALLEALDGFPHDQAPYLKED